MIHHRKYRHCSPSGPEPGHLEALGNLVEGSFPDPAQLFHHGLSLLVAQLGVDRAVISRFTDLGWEMLWWAHAPHLTDDPLLRNPIDSFCPLVLEHPNRTLVIPDRHAPGAWRRHAHRALPEIRSYLGTALRQSGRTTGVLSVSSARPHDFSRAEVSMVNALANLFGKTLEVEELKHELRLTRDALDLSTAVVEDSALEAPGTHLPNRHYLDVWMRAYLPLARRRQESIALVRWNLALPQVRAERLVGVMGALRGEDLLVDLGHGAFLLLLPRTDQDGVRTLLERLDPLLGSVPLGGTLWIPFSTQPYHQDFRDALARTDRALERAQNLALRPLCWLDPPPLTPIWDGKKAEW